MKLFSNCFDSHKFSIATIIEGFKIIYTYTCVHTMVSPSTKKHLPTLLLLYLVSEQKILQPFLTAYAQWSRAIVLHCVRIYIIAQLGFMKINYYAYLLLIGIAGSVSDVA